MRDDDAFVRPRAIPAAMLAALLAIATSCGAREVSGQHSFVGSWDGTVVANGSDQSTFGAPGIEICALPDGRLEVVFIFFSHWCRMTTAPPEFDGTAVAEADQTCFAGLGGNDIVGARSGEIRIANDRITMRATTTITQQSGDRTQGVSEVTFEGVRSTRPANWCR